MSNPQDIREQLSAYLDGELGENAARRVEEAIRAEPAIEQELEQLRSTRQLIHALPHAPAPAGFAGRVISRAERRRLMHELPGARPYRSFRWITIAAAAVVLVAAGLGMFLLVTSQHGPGDDRLAGGDTKEGTTPVGELASAPKKPDPDDLSLHGAPAGPGGGAAGPLKAMARTGKGGPTGLLALKPEGGALKEVARGKGPGTFAPSGFQDGPPTVLAYIENVEINTTDIAQARREVAMLLLANRVEPVSLTRPEVAGQQEQYIIYPATEAQLANIRSGLRALQSRQRVPQKPVLSQLNDLVAANKALSRSRRIRLEKGKDTLREEMAKLAMATPKRPAVTAEPAPGLRPTPEPPALPVVRAPGPATPGRTPVEPPRSDVGSGRKSPARGRSVGEADRGAKPRPVLPVAARPTPPAKPSPAAKPPVVLPTPPRMPKAVTPAVLPPPAPKAEPAPPAPAAPATPAAGPAAPAEAKPDSPKTDPASGKGVKDTPGATGSARVPPCAPPPGAKKRSTEGETPDVPHKEKPAGRAELESKNTVPGAERSPAEAEVLRGGQAEGVADKGQTGQPADDEDRSAQKQKKGAITGKAIAGAGVGQDRKAIASQTRPSRGAVGGKAGGAAAETAEEGHKQYGGTDPRSRASKSDAGDRDYEQAQMARQQKYRRARAIIITVNFLPDGIDELQRELNRELAVDAAEAQEALDRAKVKAATSARKAGQGEAAKK